MLKKKISISVCLLLFIASVSLMAEDQVVQEEPETKANWGFIFNTSNLLLDIESYQAGLGAKVLLANDFALRFLLDGFYASSTDTFAGSLGLAFEKNLRPGRVAPYAGGFLEVGVMYQLNETDEDNWTKNISVPISAGAILGVEFFVVESVSLFAEYNLVFEGSILTTSTSVGGVVTETDPEFSYTIDTGIGNEAMLGVIIYLDDVVEIERK